MDELLRFPGDEEFVKSFREGQKILIVRRGGNNSDRFLAVVVYAVGDWRGLLLIPDGRDRATFSF